MTAASTRAKCKVCGWTELFDDSDGAKKAASDHVHDGATVEDSKVIP